MLPIRFICREFKKYRRMKKNGEPIPEADAKFLREIERPEFELPVMNRIPESGYVKDKASCSLDEYRETFPGIPKIVNRKTVFISETIRPKISGVVRRLGSEKTSVSVFIENLVLHYLKIYEKEISGWKKL